MKQQYTGYFIKKFLIQEKNYTRSRKKYTKIWINSSKLLIGCFKKLNKKFIYKNLSNYNIPD